MNNCSPGNQANGAQRLSREVLATWLAHKHDVAASGDAALSQKHGGFSDDGESADVQTGKPLKAAAVLILVINQPETPTVLFTQRTAHLTDHAGQISFPGGRVEADDRDPFHTAMREAEEETGVDAARIDIIGTLPQYTTGTGYLITPVVAWMEPPVVYKPDPTEVDECFEVPLDFLLDINNHHLETAMYKGRMRSYYAMPYGQRYIWGATAGMLVSLTRVLGAAQGKDIGHPVRRSPDSG
ncbi:MAG: CoA pyrophosphatase [Betaproteobacteria bacterium]